MSDPIKLDPLVNQRVIFKLRGQDPMETTIIACEDGGYWVKGGTLVEHLKNADQGSDSEVRFLDLVRIEWLQQSPTKSK